MRSKGFILAITGGVCLFAAGAESLLAQHPQAAARATASLRWGPGGSRVGFLGSARRAAHPATPAEAEPVVAAAAAAVAKPAAAPSKGVSLAIEGDTLETLPKHVAIAGGYLLANAAVLIRALSSVHSLEQLIACLVVLPVAVVVADALTGLVHFALDNYDLGSPSVAFQGHHNEPWTICKRGIFNNIHKVAVGISPLLALLALVQPYLPPAAGVAGSIVLLCVVMCQELHKYSHMVRAPAWVTFFQNAGLFLSKKEHGLHHSSPYEGNYCIVTGWCNETMDKMGVFRWLEGVIYRTTGVESKCWALDTSNTLRQQALR